MTYLREDLETRRENAEHTAEQGTAMARSTYIYIIYRPVGGLVLAAFTVRHELVTWLKDRPGNKGEVRVRRYLDNDSSYGGFVDITSDIYPAEQEDGT